MCVLDGVPEAGGFLVTRIEIVETSQSTANLADAILVRFETPGRDEQAVDRVLDGGWFVREIAAHGVKRNKDFARVEAVVAGILILGLHRSDDGVRNAIHPDVLADRFPFGEELFFNVAAEEGDVAGLLVVLIVVETAFESRDATNFLEWRERADDGNRTAIEEAADLSVVAEFGHDVFAGGRFFSDLNVIVFQPTNETAGTRATGLHAGAAGENDHDVFAKRFLIFLDTGAEAFARCDHDGDRDDAPGDAEHGEERAALLRPESHQRIAKKVTKRHRAVSGYCRTIFCFSVRPERISVLTPLEIPSLTLIFLLPLGPLTSGIST